MKFTILSVLVVLAAAAIVCESAALEENPELIDNDTGYIIETTSSEADPLTTSVDPLTNSVDPLTNSVDVDPFGITKNRLIHRATFRRNGAANTVQIHNHTWRGNSRITSVRAFEIGASQGASARITAGGVGFTHVTVQMQSRVGWGFNIQLDIYGV